MSGKTHEIMDISPIHILGNEYWTVNMYWNTTVPRFKEFQDWCKDRGIRLEFQYKISRIPTWDLVVFGLKDEREALEFKMRWS